MRQVFASPWRRWIGSAGALALLCFVLTTYQAPARAQVPSEAGHVSEGEMALLPEYCAATQSFSKNGDMMNAPDELQRRYLALMGGMLHHMHHYCWAMLYIHRASNPLISADQRRALLGRATGDCLYVVDHATPDFVLLPEIFFRIGQIKVLLGQQGEAIEFFNRSREAKADYWPPYVEIAKINASIGQRKQAQDVLLAGLKLMPGQPSLEDALAKLEAQGPVKGPPR